MTPPLPNLLIIGAQKAGTTTLFAELARHPEVCASDVKETGHFIKHPADGPDPNLDGYRAHFRHYAGQPVILEATPGYLPRCGNAAGAIRALLGQPRAIALLREPVDRFLSTYRFAKSRLAIPADWDLRTFFERCLAVEGDPAAIYPLGALRYGRYAQQLESWYAAFGDDLRVEFFDDLTTRGGEVLRELSGWLGIDPTFYTDDRARVENRAVGHRWDRLQWLALRVNKRFEGFFRAHPQVKERLRAGYHRVNADERREPVPPDVRAMLEAYYRPHNAALATLLTTHGVPRRPAWVDA